MPAATNSVLLVMPQPILRRLIRELLDRQAHEVLEAETGSRALELARDLEFQAVLVHFHLPDGD